MKPKEIFYELLQDKTRGQVFYNEMMVRMANPAARELFRTFRDGEERDLINIRKHFLALEAKPMLIKSFYYAGNPTLKKS